MGCLAMPNVSAADNLTLATKQAEPQNSLQQFVAEHSVREIVFAVRQPAKDIHWYANFGYYADSESRHAYVTGGKLCRLDLTSGALRILLEDKDGTIRDPVVHYDAKRILFSYRPGQTPNFHLYEIDLDGQHLRQLTDGPFDDIEPCYLPDGGLGFISSRCKRWVQCWVTQAATMHRCDADGKNIRPLSANIEQDNTPWPLPDGRILYQRWEYVDRSQMHFHHLWTANPDGTGEMVFYGNMNPGTVMLDAKPIPETQKVVAIFSPIHGLPEHNGAITVIDPRKGPDEKSFAQPITASNDFRDPWAFSDELFMAAQGGKILLLNNSGQTEEIYRLSAENSAAGLECHEPRPIVRRTREAVIPNRTDLKRNTGTLLLMDIYQGRQMAGVKRGEIKKLLVMETLPKPINFSAGMEPITYGGSFTLERVLGTVPVEPDGSALMDLPALRALFFVALDENNMAVKRMQSFVAVQPGELTGCIGCHERRTETLLPHGNILAMSRKPSRVEPIADCPEVFDFPRDIQPIVTKLCGDCHGYETTKQGGPYAGKVLLAGDHGPMYSHAYYSMTIHKLFSDNRNMPQGNALPRSLGSSASRIMKMLDGSHYGVLANAHEKQMLRLWIDASTPYPGTYAALGSGYFGCSVESNRYELDWEWPTTRAGADAITRRCVSCHKDTNRLPISLSDDRINISKPLAPYDAAPNLSRHIVFNLSQPEKSLLLLAPLKKSSGGFELCRDEQGKPAAVFANAEDPDYQKLLTMIASGNKRLEVIKRFDMPGFKPIAPYLREMKRFGILPAEYLDDEPVNPYELDRRYWQSLWYRP
jgi:cytochrome c553